MPLLELVELELKLVLVEDKLELVEDELKLDEELEPELLEDELEEPPLEAEDPFVLAPAVPHGIKVNESCEFPPSLALDPVTETVTDRDPSLFTTICTLREYS